MIITRQYVTLEEAITAFSAESKPTLKEYARHRYYSPEAHRKHHRRAKSVGAGNRQDRKSKGRRY